MVFARRMAREMGGKINDFVTNRGRLADTCATKRHTTEPENTSKTVRSCPTLRSVPSSQPTSGGMHIGTLNIIDGRSSRLQLACEQLRRHNLDLAVLAEAKLNGMHTTKWAGYEILATKCTNQHQGGVAIAAKRSHRWHLEGVQRCGPNVIKTTLVHGCWRTRVIGACIPPSETDLSIST